MREGHEASTALSAGALHVSAAQQSEVVKLDRGRASSSSSAPPPPPHSFQRFPQPLCAERLVLVVTTPL